MIELQKIVTVIKATPKKSMADAAIEPVYWPDETAEPDPEPPDPETPTEHGPFWLATHG